MNWGHYAWQFVTSSGFGAVVAFFAAGLAYLTARTNAKRAREDAEAQRALLAENAAREAEKARKDQWWLRAQWALERVVGESSAQRVVGLRMLTSLMASDLADDQETALAQAAIDATLEAPVVTPDEAQCGDSEQSGGASRVERP